MSNTMDYSHIEHYGGAISSVWDNYEWISANIYKHNFRTVEIYLSAFVSFFLIAIIISSILKFTTSLCHLPIFNRLRLSTVS